MIRVSLACWSPRRDAVRQLYDVVLREKLVHVGVPYWLDNSSRG